MGLSYFIRLITNQQSRRTVGFIQDIDHGTTPALIALTRLAEIENYSPCLSTEPNQGSVPHLIPQLIAHLDGLYLCMGDDDDDDDGDGTYSIANSGLGWSDNSISVELPTSMIPLLLTMHSSHLKLHIAFNQNRFFLFFHENILLKLNIYLCNALCYVITVPQVIHCSVYVEEMELIKMREKFSCF